MMTSKEFARSVCAGAASASATHSASMLLPMLKHSVLIAFPLRSNFLTSLSWPNTLGRRQAMDTETQEPILQG
jgi:hypothetical protein